MEQKTRKPRARKPLEERKIYQTTTIYVSPEQWMLLKMKADAHNLTVGKFICRVLIKDGCPVVEGMEKTHYTKTTYVPKSFTGLPEQIGLIKETADKCGISCGRYIMEVLLPLYKD